MAEYPDWLKKRINPGDEFRKTEKILKDLELNTVCQAAHCPNIGECFSRGTATFMILGRYCTRNCRFCDVKHKDKPAAVDQKEPERIAEAAARLNLEHVVITSVTRDDLDDGGSQQFVRVVEAIKDIDSSISVEVLTPDFKGDKSDIKRVVKSNPEVYNHNLETVPRLYEKVRAGADYKRSLQVLKTVKEINSNIISKSGIMLGLGEKEREVISVMDDLIDTGCDILTIGQYLQPSKNHIEVKSFVTPEQFEKYKEIGEEMGFEIVVSGPLVRSSFQAKESYEQII